MEDMNKYIKKSHIKAVDKFNKELEAWCKEYGEEQATLYEDAYTSFTLSNVRVEDGKLCYLYDGKEWSDNMVCYDEEEGEYWEVDGADSIMDYLRFWRTCMKRAKRYWSMDVDRLDAIQNGEVEDEEEEDNY